MKVQTAQLPESPESDDRIFVTSNAVIMLDGASSFLPTPVATGTYVDHLGECLTDALVEEPDMDLVVALARCIEQTAEALDLEQGRSPSSTVAILRPGPHERVDALVLGDTQIAWPGGVLRDDRIALVGAAQRQAYRERLATGSGFDGEHRRLLRQLQDVQQRSRNQRDGYWIAETDWVAAHHALTAQWLASEVPWAVLATDGAYVPLQQLELDGWGTIAHHRSELLQGILDQCSRWESVSDPDGTLLPRAKRHDDKSLAAVRLVEQR